MEKNAFGVGFVGLPSQGEEEEEEYYLPGSII
jgi:hypothetical protein